MDGIQKVPMSLMRKNFASYLRVANRGEQLIVTVDGEPLAVVGPLSAMSSVTLEQLVAAGLIVQPSVDYFPEQPAEMFFPVDIDPIALLKEIRG